MRFHAITVICILLFIGAVGKSAQIGLHTRLPDAMEGFRISEGSHVPIGTLYQSHCMPESSIK